MTGEVRVGFVGAGPFARLFHYPTLSAMPGVWTGAALAGTADMLYTYGYFAENRELVDAIKEDRMPRTHFGDNLRTMRLCDRIAAGGHVERDPGGQEGAGRARAQSL
jgi:predicted dehydrogenase